MPRRRRSPLTRRAVAVRVAPTSAYAWPSASACSSGERRMICVTVARHQRTRSQREQQNEPGDQRLREKVTRARAREVRDRRLETPAVHSKSVMKLVEHEPAAGAARPAERTRRAANGDVRAPATDAHRVVAEHVGAADDRDASASPFGSPRPERVEGRDRRAISGSTAARSMPSPRDLAHLRREREQRRRSMERAAVGAGRSTAVVMNWARKPPVTPSESTSASSPSSEKTKPPPCRTFSSKRCTSCAPSGSLGASTTCTVGACRRGVAANRAA